MNVGPTGVSIVPSRFVPGPDTLIVKLSENPSSVVFLIVSDANFSLTNSQSISPIGGIVTSIEVVPLVAIGVPPESVHSTDMTLQPGGSNSSSV